MSEVIGPVANGNPVRQVICMKWGSLYGPEYVNRLYAAVRLQTKGKLRFVCLTDDASELRDEIETYPCPTIDLPEPWCDTGWRKVTLYKNSSELFGLNGDWLFLDLDVVITGSLDPFFEYMPEHPFVVMQNWTQHGAGIGNTSVFRFRVGAHEYLLERLQEEFRHFHDLYRNSQTYLSREVRSLLFWPDSWCVLFKVQCVPPWPMRLWKAPVLPKGARVVAFPGSPNPPEAMRGSWPERRLWKKIYKQIKPASWVAEYWRNAEDKLVALAKS